MRKQINVLVDIIQYNFKMDPYSNSLFLFCGRRADRIKAVHYEGDGFCLLYKRYESGRLQWPRTGGEAKQISEQQLRWLLEGLNPEQPKAVQKWLPHKSENHTTGSPESGGVCVIHICAGLLWTHFLKMSMLLKHQNPQKQSSG